MCALVTGVQTCALPISVVDASTMASQNLVSVQDIVARVPGLAANTVGSGRVQIAIRGITTGGLNNTTVGITIDDVPPIGSASCRESVCHYVYSWVVCVSFKQKKTKHITDIRPTR